MMAKIMRALGIDCAYVLKGEVPGARWAVMSRDRVRGKYGQPTHKLVHGESGTLNLPPLREPLDRARYFIPVHDHEAGTKSLVEVVEFIPAPPSIETRKPDAPDDRGDAAVPGEITVVDEVTGVRTVITPKTKEGANP
jgi:hypothetical protein